MIVVDRRPRLERLLLRRAGATATSPLARVAGRIADRLTARRVAGRAAPPPDVLVVSVGNLRVGGTGKTPVVAAIARDLAAMGVSGGVVTRGYGAGDRRCRIVDADDPQAGDEGRLLAGRLRPLGWVVVQAPRRLDGVALLMRTVPDTRVILLEDAHQTADVGRHCDVLILDRWEATGGVLRALAGPVLPLGPYRETAAGADRAAVWLVEAAEAPAARAGAGTVVAAFQRRVALRLPEGVEASRARVGLVSGLARPEGFEVSCAATLPTAAVVSLRLPDHCRYGARDLDAISALGRAHRLDLWLTTEKDLVKLDDRGPLDRPLGVAVLDVAWTSTPTLPELIEERRRGLAAESS